MPYATCTTFDQVMAAEPQFKLVRVSDPGSREKPVYTGFFFYQCQQFNRTGRYLLGMKVYCQNRKVRADDRGEIGTIDLKDNHKWTKIGETTAWNWQQGARQQWRPGSDEILWNDRADDGTSYVCRVHNFRTGEKSTRRTRAWGGRCTCSTSARSWTGRRPSYSDRGMPPRPLPCARRR